jgi:hypothetical protein
MTLTTAAAATRSAFAAVDAALAAMWQNARFAERQAAHAAWVADRTGGRNAPSRADHAARIDADAAAARQEYIRHKDAIWEAKRRYCAALGGTGWGFAAGQDADECLVLRYLADASRAGTP